MNKVICIILSFVMFFILVSCENKNVLSVTDESGKPTESSSFLQINPLPTDREICSVPLMPTDVESVMLRSAYRAMNDKFGGATVEKQEVLEIGKIYGEPCRRYYIETSKGDFVAVVDETGKVLNTWSEGEEKTTEFWFPQLCDIDIASDENLMIAFYNFYGGEYHDEDIIYDFKEEVVKDDDGKSLWKVVLYTTHCTSTFWIDVFGTVIDRTK